jgi:hypothetical protein
MNAYRVWEVAKYKAQVIESRSMHDAVKTFAGTPIVYCHGGSIGAGPGVFMSSDGSAREFHAIQVRS